MWDSRRFTMKVFWSEIRSLASSTQFLIRESSSTFDAREASSRPERVDHSLKPAKIEADKGLHRVMLFLKHAG
jgi:hypothetical protein